MVIGVDCDMVDDAHATANFMSKWLSRKNNVKRESAMQWADLSLRIEMSEPESKVEMAKAEQLARIRADEIKTLTDLTHGCISDARGSPELESFCLKLMMERGDC